MPKELGAPSSDSKHDDPTTKKPSHAEQTFPSVSSKHNSPPVCDCLNKDKRDAFFEKLICYLEKQSEVISKYCLEGRTSVENKRVNTDPIFPKENSPCREQDETDPTHLSKNKLSRVEIRDQKSDKKNDCKIYVEVCTCNKNTRVLKGFSSNRSVSRRERSSICDEVAMSNDKMPANGGSRVTRNEDNCCEKNVDAFYKLAEEICQGYLRQCNAGEALNSSQSQASKKRRLQSEEEDPCETQPRSYRDDCPRNVEFTPEHGLCRNITMEVDCHGTRQEYVIQPCDCPLEKGCTTPPSKTCPKSCLELFEDKYGAMLKQVHAMLCENQATKSGQPSGDHRQPLNQKQYPPPSQPPGKGNSQQDPATGYPMNQNPYYYPQQPPPPPEYYQPQAPQQGNSSSRDKSREQTPPTKEKKKKKKK